MTLRHKTTLTIIATVTLITLLLYAILYTIIMGEYISMDEELNQQNVKRAFSEINHHLASLRTLTAEWSVWDDTYAYMSGEYPEYIENNIFEKSFTTLKINFMLFYDIEGSLYYGEGYDIMKNEYIGVPKELTKIFAQDAFRKERLTNGMTGIITIDEKKLLICALPIQKSDWKGSKGTLIIGRYLNQSIINEINNSLVYPLEPIDKASLNPYTKRLIADSIENRQNIFTGHSSDNNIIETYGIYNDIYGEPALVFKVSSPKQIYLQGKETIMFILLYLAGAGIIIAILGSYIFNKYIISRLTNLTNEVSTIALDGNLQRSVALGGSDEIGILATSINKMLATIYGRTEELKAAHEALKKAKEEAEEANEIKSRFLANMSHEVRTPLNGIMGMTDLTYMTDISHQQRTYLEMIRYSSNILLNIINDILDYSKIEAGKLQLENIEFNLIDTVEKLTRLTSTRALQKNIEIILDIDRNIPTYVVGDSMRLNQILLNLLNNAIKFTEKGEISISVTQKGASENNIVFCISDTGIGIPSDKVDKMFEEFTQADSSITRRYGGTGLGLAISNQLIKAMGGEIKVQSKVGVGSAFTFNIPFKASNTKEIIDHSQDLKDKTILIVEKNEKIRKTLEKICQDISINYVVLSSPENAMKALTSSADFDIIIMDLYLENMDGLELSKKISGIRKEPVPVILLVSPADMIGDSILLKELNIFTQVIKPVLPSEFKSVIHDTLNLLQGNEKTGTKEQKFITLSGRTVLVAEDGYINRKIIVELLKKLHINILTADNGEKALYLFENNPVDLVIMDIEMPVMDGLEAASKIKEKCISQKRNVPIIAVTAYVLESEIQKCFVAGMDDYVCKPISLDMLYNKLLKYLAGEKFTTKKDIRYVNHQKLCDLVSGEEAFIGDLLTSFTGTYMDFIEKAKCSAKNNDIIECRKILHGLKGTAASLYIQYGLEDIIKLESQIEHLPKDTILKKINLIEEKLNEVADYIDKTYESDTL